MSKTLHLNLIRKWFDLIWNREKPQEYREIKPYFCGKFLLVNGEHKTLNWWKNWFDLHSEVDILNMIEISIIQGIFTYKQISGVTFSNGMTPPVPRFTIELKNIRIGIGATEWGAIPGVKYFVLELGKIINQTELL